MSPRRLLHSIGPVNDFRPSVPAIFWMQPIQLLHSGPESRNAGSLRRLSIGQLAETSAVPDLAGGFFQKIVDVLPGL